MPANQMLLRILIASLSVLRPAVHHVALPGHGVRERATTPQAVSLGSPPNSAYDMTSGELADKLRSLGVNWSERMRVRLTGINGKTLLETRKHELTQQAGIGLHNKPSYFCACHAPRWTNWSNPTLRGLNR